MNYQAITTLFFNNPDKSIGFSLINNLSKSWFDYQSILINDYLAGKILTLSIFLALLVLIPLFSEKYFILVKRLQPKWPNLVLGLWLVLGIFGLSFYHQETYDHYFGFLNPAPFLLFGSLFVLSKKIKNESYKKIYKFSFLGLTLFLVVLNLSQSPLFKQPNHQLQNTQNIAKFVIKEANNKPFNFALLSEHNYDAAYQFYLGEFGHPPKKLPDEKTDQLFVVCEDPVCMPVGHPKYEIASYGWTKIDFEKEVNGVKVFKLVQNPDQFKIDSK
jgi:hypothetical protein